MIVDMTERFAIEALTDLMSKDIVMLRDRGWTVKCYPFNRGGFLISFDPPEKKQAVIRMPDANG